ncbi:alpha/beta fold hydrolase [Fretibacter rubidus]|uniref:alpha/beta fold hydrolase n=1 Tax=Fretibacter rubidus TaxID=570162 RepID=UPI00352A77E4
MKHLYLTALLGLLVACAPNAAKETPASPSQTLDITTEVTTSQADVLTITRHGNPDGQTLVFIPGLASSASVWEDTVAAFIDNDIRLVQVGGFAGAAAFEPEGSYSDTITRALLDHLNANPGNDTILVGHSMGGFVSLKAAIEAQDKLDSIVIVDSLPYLAGLFMPGASPEQAKASGPMMAKQMVAMPRALFDAQQARGLAQMTKTQSAIPQLTAWGEASDQATVATIMGELMASDLRPILAALQRPVHVIMAYDTAMPVTEAQLTSLYTDQYAAAGDVTLHTIKDSFHFVQWDQADAFQATLRTILE